MAKSIRSKIKRKHRKEFRETIGAVRDLVLVSRLTCENNHLIIMTCPILFVGCGQGQHGSGTVKTAGLLRKGRDEFI